MRGNRAETERLTVWISENGGRDGVSQLGRGSLCSEGESGLLQKNQGDHSGVCGCRRTYRFGKSCEQYEQIASIFFL